MTTATLNRADPLAKDASGEKTRQLAKTRVQLDLTPRAMAILAELKDKTEAASYAEVFKNAMKLYDGILTEIERGSEFMIRDKDGNMAEFRMFL